MEVSNQPQISLWISVRTRTICFITQDGVRTRRDSFWVHSSTLFIQPISFPINFQFILCSWVRASWINVNNCPTRCDYIQFYYIYADSSTCFGWYPHPLAVWVCSWWWVRVSSIMQSCLQKYNKIIYSRIFWTIIDIISVHCSVL